MRLRFSLAGLVALIAAPAFAQPATPFEDAAIHAIQFVSPQEGWAVGDDGAIWYSLNGGAHWERQKSHTRASLRGVHFQNPFTGWVVGRIETSGGGPSLGIMLKTTDGGLKWEEVGFNVLPGLHAVRFLNDRNGFVCGDGSDAFPSGMFSTSDGGRTWKPVPGPRVPGWRGIDFNRDGMHGILAGAWSHLGTLRVDGYHDAEIDPLSGRTVCGVKLGDELKEGGLRSGFGPSFAVGDGGLVMTSLDGGRKWGFANLGLSPAALANCDFRCVEARGSHVWVAGRPGSYLLHSGDGGKTWDVRNTNFPCPINSVCFLDENTGWIAGELGAISVTTDGGKTWKLQHGGGRAAALFLHAHGEKTPLETMTLLGLREGYRCAAVSMMTADPAAAAPRHAADSERMRFAVRTAGGTTAESVWSFPLPPQSAGLPPRELLASWDRAHGGKANEQLLRQAVLAIRQWQPDVIVTDVATAAADPAEVLALLAVKEAFKQAADPKAFPEQIEVLGLKPWTKAMKLYALSPNGPAAAVKLDVSEFDLKLASSVKDLAESAVRILTVEAGVSRRCFKLIAHRMQGAETHTDLMQGIALGEGGEARRTARRADFDPALLDVLKKSAQTRKHLEGLAALPDREMAGSDRIVAALGKEMKDLPDDMAARTAFAIGMQFARAGKWAEAREVFALLVERHPAHPVAIDAYRWLLRYHASSETRRRVEIQQKLAFNRVSFDPRDGSRERLIPAGGSSATVTDVTVAGDVYRLYDSNMILKW
ncbi:MAG TPA: YCF48-related protein, partial [Gemmataceae bacterium]